MDEKPDFDPQHLAEHTLMRARRSQRIAMCAAAIAVVAMLIVLLR